MKRVLLIWLLGTIGSMFPFGIGLFFGWPSVLIWALDTSRLKSKGNEFLIMAFGRGLLASFLGLLLLNLFHTGEVEYIGTAFLTIFSIPSLMAAVGLLKFFGLDKQGVPNGQNSTVNI